MAFRFAFLSVNIAHGLFGTIPLSSRCYETRMEENNRSCSINSVSSWQPLKKTHMQTSNRVLHKHQNNKSDHLKPPAAAEVPCKPRSRTEWAVSELVGLSKARSLSFRWATPKKVQPSNTFTKFTYPLLWNKSMRGRTLFNII